MPIDPEALGFFSLAAINTLRLEALDLFDRCLGEGTAAPLETFVERQIAQEPPPLELLSQIAEDVHGRLMSLRQNHYDVRNDTLRTLRHEFGVDLTPLVPPNTLENYHNLPVDHALCYLVRQNDQLSADDQIGLRKVLQNSLDSALRLYQDMMLADHVYAYITDWLMGLHVLSVRSTWAANAADLTVRSRQ